MISLILILAIFDILIVTDITLYDVCTWPFMFTGTSILEFAFIETTSDTEIWKIYVSREPCILRWIVRREFVITWLNNMQNHSSQCKAVRYYSFKYVYTRARSVRTYICFASIHYFAFKSPNYNRVLALPVRKRLYRLFYANVNVLDNILP